MVPFPHADPAAAAGKVRVLSPAARWLMNSSYGNDPIIRKRLGNCEAAVNVDDFIDKSGAGTAVEGSSEGLKTVYFDLNSSDLSADARQTLGANAAWLKGHNVKITIEGHCDKRGSTEYNLALGERRAYIVRNYLKSLGVNPDRMAIISYGEEKPLDYSESEGSLAKNRRAEFVVRGNAE
jgi:peptidoglycan-associated lipoprotein